MRGREDGQGVTQVLQAVAPGGLVGPRGHTLAQFSGGRERCLAAHLWFLQAALDRALKDLWWPGARPAVIFKGA